MIHKFDCPHCGQRVSVTDEYLDQELNCTSCGGEIIVSREAPPPPPPAPREFDCPHCGQRVSITDDLLDNEILCPSCNGEIIVSREPPPPIPASPEFDCPYCGQLVSVATEFLDKEMLCPSCDGEIIVSREPAAAPPPPSSPAPPSPPPLTVANLEAQVRVLGIEPDIPSGDAQFEDRSTVLTEFLGEVRFFRRVLENLHAREEISREPMPAELAPIFARMYRHIVHDRNPVDEDVMKQWLQEEIPEIQAS